MKRIFGILIFVTAIGSLSLSAYAGDKTSEAKSDDPATTPADAPAKPKPHFSFGAYGTMYNTYNRGNLDDFWAELTLDPGRAVDQGSPAYFSFEGAVLFPMKPDELWIGASLEMTVPASHALWGTQISFGGGRDEIVLAPWMFSVGMPIRYRLGQGDRLFATATPSMLMGWVSGDATAPGIFHNYTPSPTFGFGMSVGGEMMFSKHFGANMKIGFRALKTDLVYEDATSSTGYSQPLLSSTGEPVQVDLGGTYMVIGVSVHR